MCPASGIRPELPLIHEVRRPGRALTDELARMTAAAFATGDAFAGLPAADGASETAASLLADLDEGVRLWVVRDAQGSPAGCVRAAQLSSSRWEVRRLAVGVGRQQEGFGRELMQGLEHTARVAGVRTLVACALVERGVPPFYSSLGYRTVDHVPSPGKPLSEAVMEKELSNRDSFLRYPWESESAALAEGVIVSWFGSARCTIAVIGRLVGPPRAVVRAHHDLAAHLGGQVRFLGADGWLGCTVADASGLHSDLVDRADSAHGAVQIFRRPCTAVTEFIMPRTVDPRLLALWRLPLRPWCTGG